MAFFFFLLSILISSFFYLRLSKRFSAWDVEVSDDIKRELTTLITEFNASAKQNIEIMEDKVKESKSQLSELLVQLEYAKKLKETLEDEINASHKKLMDFKKDQYTVAESNKQAQKQSKKRSDIHHFYNKLGSDYTPEVSSDTLNKDPFVKAMNNLKDDPFLNIKDKVEYSTPLMDSQTPKIEDKNGHLKTKMDTPPPDLDPIKELLPNTPITEDTLELSLNEPALTSLKRESLSEQVAIEHQRSMQDTKKEVIALYQNGSSIEMIANKLNLTKGEVSFMIKLHH